MSIFVNCTSSTVPNGACFDTGDSTWMIIATALVMLMIPGLALFYAGLVPKRGTNVIIIQSFFSLCWTGIVWYAVGYSLAFSNDHKGIVGDMDRAFLTHVTPNSRAYVNPNIPEYVFFAYELMFAAITPALITGAFAGRVHFFAYFLFLTIWIMLVYVPWAHWIWMPAGFLAKWGVRDFAGGIVVHTTAGFSAVAAVLAVGPRQQRVAVPHNVPLVAVGTGLLWFGWFGFNAGSELAMNGVTSVAFVNTDLAASVAAFVWVTFDWIRTRKPKLVGLLTGAVAGLATITPCAGYVQVWASVPIGICAGVVCYWTCVLVHKVHPIDDALDVFGVHGIGGAFGSILLGCFGSLHVNPTGGKGLFYGSGSFFGKQIVAVLFAAVWSFSITYATLWLMARFLPGTVLTAEQQANLDENELGEEAYSAEEPPSKSENGKDTEMKDKV